MPAGFSKATLAVILATMIWGCTTVIYVLALQAGASALGLALAIQFGIAVLLLILTLINPGRFFKTWPIVKPYAPLLVATSAIFLCRDLFFILALQNGSKLMVSVIDALWPVFMVIIAMALFPKGAKITQAQAGLLLLAYIGVVIAFMGQRYNPAASHGPWWAYGLALLGALSAGIEVNLFRLVRERTGALQSLGDIFYLSAMIRLPLFILAPVVAFICRAQIHISMASLPYIAVLLAAWTLATLFFMYGVCGEASHKVGVIAYLSPILNIATLAAVFPQEHLTYLFIIGAVIVVGANILMTFIPRKANI